MSDFRGIILEGYSNAGKTSVLKALKQLHASDDAERSVHSSQWALFASITQSKWWIKVVKSRGTLTSLKRKSHDVENVK